MELQVVQRRQKADGYFSMLERLSLFTEGARLCGEDWGFFQQENAAIHITRRSKDFFKADNIRFLDHPQRLPIGSLWI